MILIKHTFFTKYNKQKMKVYFILKFRCVTENEKIVKGNQWLMIHNHFYILVCWLIRMVYSRFEKINIRL